MPNTSDIAAQQRTFLLMVRFVTGIVFWVGLIPATMGIAFGIAQRDFRDEDFLVPFGMGVAISGFALLFWKAAPWLARLAMPRPTRVLCPSCGFDLENAVSDRCNECGLALSEEFRQGTVVSGPAANPPARLAALQGTMAGAARIVAAIAILPCCMYSLAMLARLAFFLNGQPNLAPTLAFLFATALGPAACFVCLIPWVLPRWTGRRLAPPLVPNWSAEQPPPIPARSVAAGLARMIALALMFPLLAAVVPPALYVMDQYYPVVFKGKELNQSQTNDVSIAIGSVLVGLLGLTFVAGVWGNPRLAGRLLLPLPESKPPTPSSTQRPERPPTDPNVPLEGGGS